MSFVLKIVNILFFQYGKINQKGKRQKSNL